MFNISLIKMIFKLVVLTNFLIGISRSEEISKSVKSEFKKSLSRDCGDIFSTTCLKLNIVSWVDRINEKDDYQVIAGVSLVRENSSASENTADLVAELAREYPNDADARLDAFLLKKVSGYLNSHSIKWNLSNQDHPVETARRRPGGGGGGTKGGGGGNGLGYLMAAAALSKGTLMALAMGAVAALAGKALLTGLISLVLSSIIGLKSLTSSGGKETTYEIISKPIYSHANTHSSSHEDHGHYGGGHSSYRRSLELPLPMGFQQEYKPA